MVFLRIYFAHRNDILRIKFLHFVLNKSLSCTKLFLIELFFFECVLGLFELVFELSIFLFFIDLFQILVTQCFFKSFHSLFAVVKLSLGFFDLVLGGLNLVQMPLDDLVPVIIDYLRLVQAAKLTRV